MILALLLATVSCADRGFCPTRAELEHAIEQDRQMLEGYLNHVEGEAHPESLTSITVTRPERVTGIACGKPFDLPPRAIPCRFTLHFPGRREHRAATLAKVAGAWRIVQPNQPSRP